MAVPTVGRAETMDWAQELARVWPDCRRVALGNHQVFFHEDSTPAHEYLSVIKVLDFQRAVELTARDSFDASLAAELLDQADRVSDKHFRSPGLTVFQHLFTPPYTFTCVVFVPPSVAERFPTESKTLNTSTGWFFPAFDGEFAEGQSSSDFWHMIRRKDDHQIPIVRWDRQPSWSRVQSFSKPRK